MQEKIGWCSSIAFSLDLRRDVNLLKEDKVKKICNFRIKINIVTHA